MRLGHREKRLSLMSDIIVFLLVFPVIIVLLNAISTNIFTIDTSAEEVLHLSKENKISEQEISINEKINNIEEKYGIKIEYGTDTKYLASNVSATTLDDLNIVKNNINILENAISKYPEEFFKIFNNTNSKYSLTIILLDSFSDDNIALASRNNLNEYKIYISNDANFERSFHHEMFHIIEYYMSSISTNTLFDDWCMLNPSGFNYDSDLSKLDANYVYSLNVNSEDWYFVSKYSKTSEKEDRAELFAEIMVSDKLNKYFEENNNLRKKADYLCSVISSYFTFKDENSVYWLRYETL